MSNLHSLSISVGPRPLQLLSSDSNGGYSPQNVVSPSHVSSLSPLSSSIVTSPTSTVDEVKRSRRQSSIHYYNSPTTSTWRDQEVSSPAHSDSPKLNRHSSYGPSSFPKQLGKGENRRSTGSLPTLASANLNGNAAEGPRPPVTLVEKHAELLHFIAQKESKCLELRSQLATHEAELLQLKRKWERIVSRGLERERSDSPTTDSSVISPLNATSPMLEGIRGGVQGVGRLLAYGLNSGNSISTASGLTSPPYTSSPLTNKRRSFPAVKPRLIDLDDAKQNEKENEKEILMVRDTGATPLVSPNPDFIGRKREREEVQSDEVIIQSVKLDSMDTLRARRKSRDLAPTIDSSSSAKSSSSSSPPLTPSPNVLSPLEYSEFTPTAIGIGASKTSKRSQSQNTNKFSSSSPSWAPTPSWIGAVVGNWEDTISKNQKRASVLLSDVQNSFAEAFGPMSPPTSFGLTSKPGGVQNSSASGVTSPAPVTMPSSKPNPPVAPKTGKLVDIIGDDNEWNW
ncbi:hypothetical protein C8J56DRAFT_1047838 [Mycena floridula]|nr:hypothetical protein C8J56DRAFT_1047838 [Mycena floridula]